MSETKVSPSHSGNDDSETCVRVEGLTKTFNDGAIVAAEDINLDIKNDEFVVFLGPSGCGKTTTLRCISGLEEPDEGQVYINSEDITYAKPKDRDLAFVFQSIALFPHMSVRRNIRFGLDMKSDLPKTEKNERVDEVAEMLGIEEMLDRKPSALSGGQQQRVSLGRAMVMEPAAFLLDEPFSALDANLRDRMRVEVKKLQRELGTAMIFVTHDQEEAMTLGDRIVVMNDGHIYQIGSPSEIYNEPTQLFVAQFIGSPSTNFFECTVRQDGDVITLVSSLFEMTLSVDQTEAASVEGGDRATIGVRPENIHLSDTGSGLFNAEIEVIEHQGDRDVVHFLADSEEYTSLTQQNKLEDRGQTVGVNFDSNDIWIFDEENQRAL
ncbi:ABC transporter ATP-binding protein [Halobellus ordinarius]|uniref:ABC transporter ATP-binding protein n=1 Tax=Halobellus ordinarius TaxID=3075120 RepID=UPI0028807166|nr:ABC transporter ATP-binding protein [Halobellus sp. ZY16]